MRFKENELIAEAYAKVNEAKMKPSAGLTKKQKSNVVKKARAGKDIGKKGPGFAKMAKAAGGGEKGKKIAAASMWKSVKRESAGILDAYKGKELLNEAVSSDQYESIVDIIYKAVNNAANTHPELSAEIHEVWDVVTELWGNYEDSVLDAIMGEDMSEGTDPMIPKAEDTNEDAFLTAEFAIQDAMKKLSLMNASSRGVGGKTINTYTTNDVVQALRQARVSIRALYTEPNVDEDSIMTAETDVLEVAKTVSDISKISDNLKKLGNAKALINQSTSSMGESADKSDPMIPKVEKILRKMTEDLGSEDLAVEELSKWDEDEMNEYYNNHLMGEEDEEEDKE